LLEYPSNQDKWWQSGLTNDRHDFSESSEIENFGIVDDREDMARLKNYLDEHPVQVLLGIHSKALPDRGTLRKLDQIAAHAKDGLIVQLLSDADLTHEDEPVDKQAVRYQQWQTALSARKIGLVDIDS